MNTETKRLILPGTDTAMAAYSPALSVGDWVFVSGQGPLDVATKKFVLGPIEQQVELTLKNVRALLEVAGCTMDDCVKMTVHLTDIADFDKFNTVYRGFFTKPYPTRTTVQSFLGANINVEIDAIALRGCGKAKGQQWQRRPDREEAPAWPRQRMARTALPTAGLR